MYFLRFLLALVFFICFVGCGGPAGQLPVEDQSSPSKAEPQVVVPEGDIQSLRVLTDQILLSLASHRFERLKFVLEPGLAHLNGQEIARALLGPEPQRSRLDRWNAEGIVVSVHPDGLRGESRVRFYFRRRANRQSVEVSYTFHFLRANSRAPWKLTLP
ncbi:MAG: hypothetical protein IIB64_08085 [Proteobacteria bacterium]|nr:hypothetical protein [Pseudomonadota bacterium]